MLDQFQQAFADLIASPDTILQVRFDPNLLRKDYELSDLEHRRLIVLANDPKMERNCTLYRANRLAPLVTYLPGTCKALGDDLRDMLSLYCKEFPHTDVNFFTESRRFGEFLLERIEKGEILPILEKELANLKN